MTDPVRRLVLLRHAKAEAGGVDEQRPLALAGRRQCPAVGAGLVDRGLLPGRVLVSSAVRTRQTWDLVRGSLGEVDAEVRITERLYLAGAEEVLALVGEVPDDVTTVLVVGHEPTMSATAAVLARTGADLGPQDVRTGLPTAGYAVVQLPSWADVAPGSGTLLEVVRPAT